MKKTYIFVIIIVILLISGIYIFYPEKKEEEKVLEKVIDNEEELGDISSKFPFDDEIILSLYWVPYVHESKNIDFVTEKQFKYMKDAGINLVYGTGEGDVTYQRYQEKMAKYCKDNGIGFIAADWDLIGYTGKSGYWGQNYVEVLDGTKIKELVSRYTKYSSVKGFYMKDEPEISTVYIKAYKYLKEAAPNGYMKLNFLPYIDEKGISNITEWLRLSKEAGYSQYYITYDFYPYTAKANSVDMSGTLKHLDIYRRIGLAYGVKTGNYIQAVQWNNHRSLGKEETWHQFNLGLAFGFKQFIYFTWFTPSSSSENFSNGIFNEKGEPNAKYNDYIKEIGNKIRRVGKTMVHLDSLEVYESKNTYNAIPLIPDNFFLKSLDSNADFTVSYMRDKRDGRNYTMIVNNSITSSQKFKVEYISSITKLSYLSYDDGKLHDLKGKDNIYTIELGAGEAIIIALPVGYEYQSTIGDINNDGFVSALDYVLIRKHILKTVSLSGEKKDRADVNKDGKVNTNDYITVRKAIISGNKTIEHQTGWKKLNNKLYYYDSNGHKVVGWQKLKRNKATNWYFFNGDGAASTGWQQLIWDTNVYWFYFKDDGVMVTNEWQKSKDKWYYLNENGIMVTNDWLKYKDKWYYLGSDGAMYVNTTKTINGKTYHFNASGECDSEGC